MMLDGNLPLDIQANVTGRGEAAFYLRTMNMSMSSRCRNGCPLSNPLLSDKIPHTMRAGNLILRVPLAYLGSRANWYTSAVEL